jgi:hypothetical protein
MTQNPHAKNAHQIIKQLETEKKRLEKIFSDVDFQGLDDIAICFGSHGLDYEARIMVLCDDVFPRPEKIWVACHPVSSLAKEKIPDWLRLFCKKLSEFFEKNHQVRLYIKGSVSLFECVMGNDCDALHDFLKKHQKIASESTAKQ